jgi:ribosomal protein S18 acetylase RimI-like enzyme
MRPADLAIVASWLRSREDCRLWCGARVAYPIDLAALPEAIEVPTSQSWTLVEDELPVAFGQLVRKRAKRLHLARIICAPDRRRGGLGSKLTRHLLDEALAQQAAAISLNVARDNAAARALYRSLGFHEAPRPPDEPPATSLYLEHAGR